MSQPVLLSQDLIFTTKIRGTAEALGKSIAVTGNVPGALAAIGDDTVQLLIDLSAPITGEQLSELRNSLPEQAQMTAFGSHVDTQRLADARNAGCDRVLARSEFVKQLIEILQYEPESKPS